MERGRKWRKRDAGRPTARETHRDVAGVGRPASRAAPGGLGVVPQASKYLEADLFAPDEGRAPLARALRTTLRTFVLAVRGFLRDDAFHHASALAFHTVLALVPMLVIAFATLRGLGAYDAFLDGTVRPWIEHSFGAGTSERSTLREAFLLLFELGEGANLAALGFVGVLFLLYLVVLLLATTEAVLNRIWGVHRPRRWIRKAADYAAILFVIPFAMSFATTAASALRRATWLAPAHDVLELLASLLAMTTVLAFLYLVMPHTRVRVRSALFGGAIAAALELTTFWAYTTFQIGVARYNLLYSSFAALPLFLVFVVASWNVILFGAELAAAHQSPRGFRWRIRHREPSAASRRRVSLLFSLEITRAFLSGKQPPTLRALADAACVPERFARDLLEDLVAAGIVVQAIEEGRSAYALARDPSAVLASDVLDAIDRAGDSERLEPSRGDSTLGRADEVLAALDAARRGSDADLRTLASA